MLSLSDNLLALNRDAKCVTKYQALRSKPYVLVRQIVLSNCVQDWKLHEQKWSPIFGHDFK
ncbi:hypothetical protein A1QE_16435 [Vibrio breoganii ZF-55]|nr:hypothetical protein A1QE_16435 [Vibrio breoganii ZF-55]